MENTVNIQINILGNVFSVAGKLQGDFDKLKLSVESLDKSVNKTFSGVKKTIDNINLTSIITQVKEVSAGLAAISTPGIGFEQSIADLSSITGISGKELDQLGKTARRVGKESGLGAAEAAKAFTTIASQIEIDDIGLDGLKELQAKAVTLAHASAMPLEQATTALVGTINQFGFEAGEAGRVINVLAAGSKAGGAEIEHLAQSFKVVGSQAAIAGLSLEETAGALEVLAKNEIKGSEAGTDLRNIILSLQTVFGADLKKMTLAEALDQLKPKMEDATFMADNFGKLSMASAQFLIKNAESIGELTEQVTDTNTAAEQAAIRTDTVAMMMARCRAKVEDLKIGFFNLTGSFGGYMTLLSEQAVMIAQLLPLFSLMGKGLMFVTSAAKLQALWAGIVKVATIAWTGAQWAFNASLWGCPLVWIIGLIAALIAIIIVCVTKVEGWGKQWDSITNFMKLTGQLFVESFKYRWDTMVNGIMIGLDYIKLGWYKFKQAVGLGDSAENDAMISQINADIDRRKTAIVDGANNLADLAKQAKNALTWELSWKKSEDGQSEGAVGLLPGLGGGTKTPSGLKLNLDGKKGRESGSGSGSSSTLDLNKIVPDLKGSTSYSAIASRLQPIRMAGIAAAASVAMPLTVAATHLPQRDPALDASRTEYATGNRNPVTMTKFCDKIEIHIANADGKGYNQVRAEVEKTLRDFFDDHGA